MLRGGIKCLAVAVVLLTIEITSIESSNILAIFPFQTRSHTIMASALVKELAKRGHNMTMITHYPEKEKIANYTDIYLNTTMMDVIGTQGNANRHFEADNNGVYDKLKMVLMFLFRLNALTCDMMLEEEEINKLIHNEDVQFDLVIVEAFFNECFLGFVHKFKAPLIQVCTFSGAHWMGDWFGNPNPYAYVPDVFTTFSDKMDFWERLVNTITGTFVRFVRQYLYIPDQDANLKKHFGFLEGLPSVTELEYNTSLLLINHHFSIGNPRPLMPAMVQVGGLHLKPAKKLPEDLQKYLDDAPNGVVYFSLGSGLQSAQMPESKRNAFLQAFSQLKQKVLWKWENDTLPGQPSNVKLAKWFPQSDILAHPNVRLFITHGGLLSTQEAIYRGVPLVGIPIFADQVTNMKRAESSGIGVLLNFRSITPESVKLAVTEVLENPRYTENAQRLSRIFRDQPLTPLEQAVYWTEYVIRHKGAPHMRSAALDLTWYQYFLLDVIAVLLLALATIFLIIFFIFRALFRICCRRSRRIDTSKKRN